MIHVIDEFLCVGNNKGDTYVELKTCKSLGPFRNGISVFLNKIAFSSSVKQTRQLIVNGVVIDICTVYYGNRFFGIDE